MTYRVFTFTGADQTYVVPAGVTSLRVKLWAGNGGGGHNITTSGQALGGPGAYATGLLAVTPGETLTIVVGGGGIQNRLIINNPAVYGGGGSGWAGPFGAGGSGGGRSAIRRGATDVVTVGGGAGAGSYGQGGSGGSTTDGVGNGKISQQTGSPPQTLDGLPGTTTAGGAVGTDGNFGSAGTSGTQYVGGNGGGPVVGQGGGGGGGGFYGGGGGVAMAFGAAGGGGGGSSLTSGLTSATVPIMNTTTTPEATNFERTPYITGVGIFNGSNGSNGLVTISHNEPVLSNATVPSPMGAFLGTTTQTVVGIVSLQGPLLNSIGGGSGAQGFLGYVETRVAISSVNSPLTPTTLSPAFFLATTPNAVISTALTPLGSVQSIVLAQTSAIASLVGVMGASQVLAANRVDALLQISSPLGNVLSQATANVNILGNLGSPLGQPKILGFHDYTDKIVGDYPDYYVVDLIDSVGSRQRVAVSSWQATLQSGLSNYVQCVVPAVADKVDAINNAIKFIIFRRTEIPGVGVVEQLMAESGINTAVFDRGPNRYTCTLSGYTTGFFEAEENPSSLYDRVLQDVRSISVAESGIRVRCSIDWLLRPSQRAYVSDRDFIVSFINYYVGNNDAYMDVGERV